MSVSAVWSSVWPTERGKRVYDCFLNSMYFRVIWFDRKVFFFGGGKAIVLFL